MKARAARIGKPALALLAWLALGAVPAAATTLARLSLAEMARAADTIVRARCAAASSRWEDSSIWTFTEFDTLENLNANDES